ncbi:MAG: DUF5020 family protein [Bacteroidaceae bacterium]|nr:DUF5020 family protein [Bacteroidaceae bacterium]
MKKTARLMALIAAMLCLPVASKAQNIQVLYDTNRECITTTLEKFTPDAWGSTFFFVDMDYSPKAVGAYTEIAREFCFWQDSEWNWLSVHAEFNGGLNTAVGSFNNSWLLGLTYSGHSEDFSKTWSVTASYKAIPGTVGLNLKKQPHNFQLTGVWGISFADGWCSFSGFADIWREARIWQGTDFIFISEPQLWVNLNKINGWDKINLAVGGEVELSNNFVDKGFRVMPALGAKWTF